MIFLPNGVGGTSDVLATAKPLVESHLVLWVSSLVGNDANQGTDRENPLATLNQAIAAATADDIIVLMAGHTETRTTAITIAQNRLTIVGEGTDITGKPSVQLKNNHATNKLLNITGTDLMLRNIYFPENLINNGTNPRVDAAATAVGLRVEGCYFDVGNNDEFAMRLTAGISRVRIRNTTIISTATSSATRPSVGLQNGVMTDLELDRLILSDGQFGFISGAMFGSAITGIRGLAVQLLLGADINIAGSTGWVNVQTSTGGGQVTL